MSINKQLDDVAKKELRRQVRKITGMFELVKKKHTALFLGHPVTQAMLGDSDAGLLKGSGSLNSFFGITSGEAQDHINEILKIYGESYVSSAGQAKTSRNIHIYTPSREEIFAATPLSWAKGRSWAEGVEKGFGGLGYFLEGDGSGKFSNSRSGKGIQTKTKLRSGGAEKRRYISLLVNNFHEESEQILNKI